MNKTNETNKTNGVVNMDEYFEFVKSHKKYSNHQKKYLMWYFENINNNYISGKSNNQIHNLIKSSYSNGDVDKITKIDILFSKFAKNNAKYIISKIRSNTLKSDDDVINFISKLTKQIKYKGGNYKSSNYKSSKNINLYKNDWKYMIDYIVLKIQNFINSNKIQYLDVGCGNGHKTKIFGDYLKIEPSNLHGCDISTWGPYTSNKDFGFNFSLIKNGSIDYADSTFDIITVILTLHHVEKLNEFIMEIKRILKLNGLLILIEHNIYDDDEAMLIDVQHLFFGAFVDNDLDFAKNGMYTKCYNMVEWEFILSKHNFQNLQNEMLFPQLENRLRYDSLYYGIFQKK